LCVKIEFLRIHGNSEVPSALEDCAKCLSKIELLVLARCSMSATSVETLSNAIDSVADATKLRYYVTHFKLTLQ